MIRTATVVVLSREIWFQERRTDGHSWLQGSLTSPHTPNHPAQDQWQFHLICAHQSSESPKRMQLK